MKNQTRMLSFTLVLISLSMLTSCARLSIEPPTPEKQSLLVLPATHTNKAQMVRHAFYYVYEITSDDNQLPPYEAAIRFPLPDGVLIVDSLPPGDYRVSSFSYVQTRTGDRTYGKDTAARNDRFTLRPGTITIFDKSLNLLTFNPIVGRGGTTSYKMNIERVTPEQRQRILQTLGQLENFHSWKVQEQP